VPPWADPLGIDLRQRRQHADRAAQVGQLATGILLLALPAALAKAPVVERQRDETRVGQPFGVGSHDLVLDARKRPGECQSGMAALDPAFRDAHDADEIHSAGLPGDALASHDPTLRLRR
jgi:hypothetical protein